MEPSQEPLPSSLNWQLQVIGEHFAAVQELLAHSQVKLARHESSELQSPPGPERQFPAPSHGLPGVWHGLTGSTTVLSKAPSHAPMPSSVKVQEAQAVSAHSFAEQAALAH